ncbi:MAG TPA: AAA family ATPase [Vicinamibacterales bacterium]|jgi:pilus assembly protein CpaE|nr:AAA family ATPase [Vicinamibacterales bacterium]
MAQLAALIVTQDEDFRRRATQLLRAGGVPIGMVEGRTGETTVADLGVVDIRWDVASGLAAIERLRAGHPALAIFAVAAEANPDLILQSMRAGANEFFAWESPDSPSARTMVESFHGAIRRTAARKEAAHANTRQPCVTYVFFGAKGGAGTTTVAVNSAVELTRLTKKSVLIVDLKACGEVALFLGVRPRFTILDAVENLHRLDKDFLKELVAKHKSGLDILAGSEQFERPGAQDAPGVEEVLRVLTRLYDYIVVDAGNTVSACATSAFYGADSLFLVTNPDLPSVRNAQRFVERVRQLGAGAERIRVLLNRDSDQPIIAQRQIETALGYSIHHAFSSDYRTVSAALNAGVPLTLANHSEISEQFGAFTRSMVGITSEPEVAAAPKRAKFLGIY